MLNSTLTFDVPRPVERSGTRHETEHEKNASSPSFYFYLIFFSLSFHFILLLVVVVFIFSLCSGSLTHSELSYGTFKLVALSIDLYTAVGGENMSSALRHCLIYWTFRPIDLTFQIHYGRCWYSTVSQCRIRKKNGRFWWFTDHSKLSKK